MLGLGGLCSYGCAVEYAWFVGSDGSSRELTRASTGEDTYTLDDKLVLRLDGGVLALTLDEDVLKGGGLEGTLNVTLKG
ncbi:MAG: hypothetical protein F7B18_03645, partial [Desulfurococcales archaeon]|nr:hypothetical protein [Desulfurococcales archaeon]